MKITVFQALTLLAKKYKDDQENQVIYQQVKHLYLSGVRTDQDQDLLTALLKDESLKDYEITDRKEDINEDPTRRYFESQLCLETLKNSLDDLDLGLLQRNFNKIFSNLPITLRIVIDGSVYQNRFINIVEKVHTGSKNYAEEIKYLKEKESFKHLKPQEGKENKTPEQILKDRKEKLLLIEKSSHAAMSVANRAPKEGYPLNLYHGKEDYVYQPKNRGRTDRKDLDGSKQVVKTNSLGIMRSYMPLPSDDSLFSYRKSDRVRPADKSKYVDGAQQPEDAFKTKVTPFVNSISGTILCQLRVFADLYRNEKFVYSENEEQLKLYFKNFVSYILYNSGAHSLDEFIRVLQLPEVQEEFKDVPGFSDLTLENLFKNENEAAFEEALNKTISYNDSILAKKALHEELVPKIDENLKAQEDLKVGVVEDDLLTNLVRDGLKKNEVNKTSIEQAEKDRLDQAKKEYVENSSSERAVKELIEICATYKTDLIRYYNEIKDKDNDPDFFIQKGRTEAAIKLIDKLKKDLEKENIPPFKKIEKFKKEIIITPNQNQTVTENAKENNKILNEAYKGKSFLQKVKEFFGLVDKKMSTFSFFKRIDETLRTPEEKEEIQKNQNIETLKFTHMR